MPKQAKQPNDLEKLFVECANAGDLEGLLALYEPGAIVDFGDGKVATGLAQLRKGFADYLAGRTRLAASSQSAALCSGDIALTSSRTGNGDVTAEIARRQPEGHWLWVVDQFALVRGKEIG